MSIISHTKLLLLLMLFILGYSQVDQKPERSVLEKDPVGFKNYIGYTSGLILTQGISYRRWLYKRFGAQVTVGLPEELYLETIRGDTTVYERIYNLSAAGFLHVCTIQNLGFVCFFTASLIHSKAVKYSRYLPQPGAGLGLEFYIWGFCTMAAFGISPPVGSQQPMYIDFGTYFRF
jgi:hypothetical protein